MKKIKVSLKCNKNQAYFSWRSTHICYHISFSSP